MTYLAYLLTGIFEGTVYVGYLVLAYILYVAYMTSIENKKLLAVIASNVNDLQGNSNNVQDEEKSIVPSEQVTKNTTAISENSKLITQFIHSSAEITTNTNHTLAKLSKKLEDDTNGITGKFHQIAVELKTHEVRNETLTQSYTKFLNTLSEMNTKWTNEVRNFKSAMEVQRQKDAEEVRRLIADALNGTDSCSSLNKSDVLTLIEHNCRQTQVALTALMEARIHDVSTNIANLFSSEQKTSVISPETIESLRVMCLENKTDIIALRRATYPHPDEYAQDDSKKQ